MNMYVCMHSRIRSCVLSSSLPQQWRRGEAGCHGDGWTNNTSELLNIHNVCGSHLLALALYFLSACINNTVYIYEDVYALCVCVCFSSLILERSTQRRDQCPIRADVSEGAWRTSDRCTLHPPSHPRRINDLTLHIFCYCALSHTHTWAQLTQICCRVIWFSFSQIFQGSKWSDQCFLLQEWECRINCLTITYK